MQTGCHVSIIAPRVSAKQNDVSLTPATLDGDRLHLSSMHPQPRAGYQACMQELGSCTAGLTNKFGFGRHLCIPCRQGCNAFHATPLGCRECWSLRAASLNAPSSSSIKSGKVLMSKARLQSHFCVYSGMADVLFVLWESSRPTIPAFQGSDEWPSDEL